MKKTYQSPETLIVLVSTAKLIAASSVEDGFNTSNPIGTTDATSGNLSRSSSSIWDEDEEF